MSIPAAIFPNYIYLNGLRVGDATVVESLYNEFRQPVARLVEAMGGNYADGTTFFRVALMHTAEIIASDNYPEEIPVEQFIGNLAMRHYQDWRFEKIQEFPAIPLEIDKEKGIWVHLPEEAALRAYRNAVRTKKAFNRLESSDQKAVLEIARLQAAGTEAVPPSALYQYLKTLGVHNATIGNKLPSEVLKALTDRHSLEIWLACEAIEQRLNSSQIPLDGENKTIRYAFITLMMLTVVYLLATWLFKDQTPKEVYQNNFNPPPSILADIEQRYASDSIAPEWPSTCTEMFAEADDFYQKKEWRSAATVLAAMLEETPTECQTDVYFYLAIVGLYLERPELTLQCIAKIDDLDRFGEDIYWYMALAYVKKAALDPSEKDIARRALERALSNTEIPERRTQAEKMLEDLSD